MGTFCFVYGYETFIALSADSQPLIPGIHILIIAISIRLHHSHHSQRLGRVADIHFSFWHNMLWY